MLASLALTRRSTRPLQSSNYVPIILPLVGFSALLKYRGIIRSSPQPTRPAHRPPIINPLIPFSRKTNKTKLLAFKNSHYITCFVSFYTGLATLQLLQSSGACDEVLALLILRQLLSPFVEAHALFSTPHSYLRYIFSSNFHRSPIINSLIQFNHENQNPTNNHFNAKTAHCLLALCWVAIIY